MPELISASPVFFCYSIIEQLLQKDTLARPSWNTAASARSISARSSDVRARVTLKGCEPTVQTAV